MKVQAPHKMYDAELASDQSAVLYPLVRPLTDDELPSAYVYRVAEFWAQLETFISIYAAKSPENALPSVKDIAVLFQKMRQ